MTIEEYYEKVKELTDYLKNAPDRCSKDCNEKHDELMKLLDSLVSDLKKNKENKND